VTDQYTETTSQSWLSRLAGSLAGVIVGFVLVLIAIGVLLWNEGRAVQTARSLAEGGKVVIDVEPSPLDHANEGKLIHVSGNVVATAPLVDPEFGVSTVALHLVRVAEMYQWKEEKHEETHKSLGGSEETTTTYSYNKVWSDQAIDSQNFRQAGGHSNPPKKYSGFSATAADATLGVFHPSARALDLLPLNGALRVDGGAADTLKPRIPHIQTVDGKFFIGADPDSPQIGDYRISYLTAPLGEVSFVGRQAGPDIVQYQTKAGDRLLMAASGNESAAQMFKEAEQWNVILTFAIRIGGFLFIWLGTYFILRPLVIVADVVPLIGSALAAGAGLVALAVAIVETAAVIAIAWLWYRPLVSLIVVAVGLAVGLGLHRISARRSAPASALKT
jgi:Transmembrane protein 43